jgi:similar to stage IV sporulation protein
VYHQWRNRRGVLEVQITGVAVERFLNLALQQGILLQDVKWVDDKTILCKVALSDVYSLRPLARSSRCRLHFKRRWGLPFLWQKLNRRRMLVIGYLVFLLLFYFMGQIAFDIQVVAKSPISAQEYSEIMQLAEQKDVKKGKFIRQMDFDAAAKHIMMKTDYLTFVSISARGNKISIGVVKRRDLLKDEKPLPYGNIIAAKDALIEGVLVAKGEAMVKSGDQVKAGDLLILGYDDNGPQAASGIVKARTSYLGVGESLLKERGMKNSGRKTRQLILAWGGQKRLIIWGDKKPDYKIYSQIERVTSLVFWRNICLPVEVISNEFREQIPYEISRSAEDALEKATSLAQIEAERNLPFNAKAINMLVLPLETADGRQKVRVVIDAQEDIGKFVAYDVKSEKNKYSEMQKQRQKLRTQKDF